MSFLSKGWVGVGLVLVLAVVAARVSAESEPANTTLRALARRSRSPATWPRLGRYAESASDPQQKGLAYFLLGYREYQAQQTRLARANLEKAAATQFSLADYAVYFAAAAAQAMGEPLAAHELLQGFSSRFPGSPLWDEALALYAQAYLNENQGQRAVEALTAEPRWRQKPALALVLAKAYEQAEQPAQAARIDQEVYYAFPLAPEARAAGDALDRLKSLLGAGYPSVSEEMRTARPDKLFEHSRYREALDEYTDLLEAHPDSALAPRWTLGRAQSLLELDRGQEALDMLGKVFRNNPAKDAERLATLAQAYARLDDVESLKLIVKQLGEIYPESPAYARALDYAGNHLVRKNDWDTASRYYEPLARLFPQSGWADEADWRVAWDYYLQKDAPRARQAMVEHLSRFPNSSHVPGALYWLGRLAESSDARDEAREFYETLEGRFKQSYFAAKARSRRASLPVASAAGFPNSSHGSEVAALAHRIPPLVTPPFKPCAPAQPGGSLLRFEALGSISLDDLAEEYVNQMIADRPQAPDLVLALARLEMQKGDTATAVLSMVRLIANYTDFDFPSLPREIWELLYPQKYWRVVQKEAHARHVDPYLVMGLIRQESAFNARAVSRADARGLMQVRPQTATRIRRQRRGVARRLFDPAYNLRVGTTYLAQLSKAFDGNKEEALAAYHAGEVRVSDWLHARTFSESAEFLETIPIPSTRIYVERVLRDAAIYRQLLTGSASFADCQARQRPRQGGEPSGGGENHPKTARRPTGARHRSHELSGRQPTVFAGLC